MTDEEALAPVAEASADSPSEAGDSQLNEELASDRDELEPPPKGKSDSLIPSGEQGALDQMMPMDEVMPPSEGAEEACSPDEEGMLQKKSRSDSVLKRKPSRPSLGKDEAHKRHTKSAISLGDRKSMAKTAEDTRRSRAKIALGSIIDIRRASVAGEIFDRKAARFMNTYKMESDNPFDPEQVDKILEAVMMEALENLTYDPEKCPKQAKWASMAIRAKVKALEFDRYKIISIVSIGEKNSQDVLVTCRFLWDAEKDRYSTFSMENTYVFGIAQCFGLYYE